MKLKRPVAARILIPAFWSGLCLLVTLPLLLLAAQAIGGGGWRLVPLFLSLGAPWALVTGLVSARSWRNVTWNLSADDAGITLKHGSQLTRIAWAQIETCREEGSALERDGASWVTLRDSEDRVLLRWERSWFGHSKRSLEEFDQFTEWVRQRVGQG